MVAGQPEHYQAILRLKYAGTSNREIAAQLGLNEKTIRRVLEKMMHAAIE